MDTKVTAGNLRKIAQELRERSVQRDKGSTTKSAQVLLAANGLQRLQDVLRGDGTHE